MVIFLANLQSISDDLYEAAEIDGASGFTRFFRITLPLMCPSVKIVAVTGLIGGMKAFDVIYSMTSGGPGDATQTVMMVMMRKGISDGFYNQGAAFGVCFLCVKSWGSPNCHYLLRICSTNWNFINAFAS